MEGKIESQIKESLKNCSSAQFEELKPNIKEHLVKIETYFQECINVYEDSIEKIKMINLSTRGICEGAKVSKSTIYGTPIPLREYVESRTSEISTMFYTEKMKKLEEEYNEVKTVLNNNLELFVKSKKTETHLIAIQEENNRLQQKINLSLQKNSKLVEENQKLKQELKNTKQGQCKVTKLY